MKLRAYICRIHLIASAIPFFMISSRGCNASGNATIGLTTIGINLGD